MARPFGHWLLNFPHFLTASTYGTLWFEILGPVFLFCPVFTGPVRTMFSFLFVLLHVGFYSTLYVGFFPFVSSVAMIPFLPTWFWEKSEALWRRSRPPKIEIYFDGDCGFCKRAVRILK